jgi:transmembrane sensor
LAGVATLGELPLRLQADHLTAIGERQRLNLQDGTQVVLNTESALSSQATQGERSARLYQGEAWFDVPGRTGPLALEAGPVLAQANGSVFSVRLLAGHTRVQVERGEVDLQDSHHQRLRLPAGMSVEVQADGFGQPAPLDPDQDLAWVRGRLVFVDRPLRLVLADLSRYYPGWIISTRAALGERRVTGNYSVQDPASVVRALAQLTSATVRELPRVMILY